MPEKGKDRWAYVDNQVDATGRKEIRKCYLLEEELSGGGGACVSSRLDLLNRHTKAQDVVNKRSAANI